MFKKLPALPSILLSVMLASCGGGGGGSSGGGTTTSPPPSSPPTPSPVVQIVASDAVVLNGIDPATADNSDLASFGSAVGDRQIVLLTEPTHGDGATFTLKTRLVKYLHEQKGFNVLFMESGMYDVARIQQRRAAGGDSISVQGPGRVYYMYSRTATGQQVLKYVDSTLITATPLALWGHDVPMNGLDSTGSLLPNLQAFLTAQNSTLPTSSDWPGYLRVARQGVALNSATLAPADATSFLSLSAQLINQVCAMPDDNGVDLLHSAGFWCRIATGIQADYTHLWSGTDSRTPTDLRDITGAGNIQWLLNGRLKGQKTIVWLHGVHGFNGQAGDPSCADPSAASQECGPGWTNVGTNLVKAYGDQVYVTHFTAGQGVYNAYPISAPCDAPFSGFTLPPLSNSMFEYYLAASGKPTFMPYPSDAAARSDIAALSIFELNYNADKPHVYGSGYTGLFYIPQLSPVSTDCAAYPVASYQ